jgi:hypothetical protein
METIAELWEILAAIPAEVAVPALGVFAIVAFLRVVGLVSTGDQARLAVAIITYLSSGVNANTMDEATVAAGVAIFAALYHWVWERAIQPLVGRAFASVTAERKAT